MFYKNQRFPIGNINIDRLEVFPLRVNVPHDSEIFSSGILQRQGCLIRIWDSDGAYGWGEVWCGYLKHSAESRAHLIMDIIYPLLAVILLGVGIAFAGFLIIN